MRIFDADSINWDKCPCDKRDMKNWILSQDLFVQSDSDDDITVMCKAHNSFVVAMCGYLDYIAGAMKMMRGMLIASIIFAASSAIAGLIQLLLSPLK